MRRKDREKDSTFALKVISTCEYATMATVNSDGTPYCVPISPVVYNGDIYFHCALVGKKIDNINHNDTVCVSCVGHTKLLPEAYSTEYESAVITGKCVQVITNSEKVLVLRLLCEKYASSNMGDFDNVTERLLSKTSVYKITITKISGKART